MEVNVLLQSSDHPMRWFTCIPKGAGWLRGVEVRVLCSPFKSVRTKLAWLFFKLKQEVALPQSRKQTII